MASFSKTNTKIKLIDATENTSVSAIPFANGQLIIDNKYDLYVDLNNERHILSSSIADRANLNKITIQELSTAVSQLDESLTDFDNYISAVYALEGAIDSIYHLRAEQIIEDPTKTASDMDDLFVEWWGSVKTATTSNNDLMARWFSNILYDNRVHGVKMPNYSYSTSYISELTDDSAGLTCVPSTASEAGNDPFAKLPQFWCVEAAVDKNTDGTHTIRAVQHIDDIADVRSGDHLCWVFQKNTFRKEWSDENYSYLKIKCTATELEQQDGWKTWPQGTDRQGNVYPYIGNPKYLAGRKACSDGSNITCGTNLKPYNFTSHTAGVGLWRQKNVGMSGASGNLLRWQMDMVRLKYGTKGNSNIIVGCCNYNYDYKAAVTETNVESVVITTAQAANILVGSYVSIGTSSRNANNIYVKITSIESVEIDGTTYARVYVDNGGTTFNTTAGSTCISTMPYFSGWNDTVLGNDGSKISYSSGKEPGLIQKTEFMIGAYMIVSDELLQWGKDESDRFILDLYVCHDQSLVNASGITSDYHKVDGATLLCNTGNGWKYIGDTYIDSTDNGILWPNDIKASGTGVGVQAGVSVNTAASGVRASWCCGSLHHAGDASLACRSVYNYITVAYGSWDGALGSPGLAG